MTVTIPSNVVPWLIGAIVLLPLSIRSWIHSKRLSTPTTRYFTLTGLLGGLALAFYSIPSIIVPSTRGLQIGFLVGIPLLYAMLIYQSYYTWYAVLQRRIAYAWILVPTLIVGIGTMLYEMWDTTHGYLAVKNGELIFNFSAFSRITQSLLLLLVLVNGLYILKQSLKISDRGSKLRFISLGILFTGVAVSTILDNLIFQGENESPLLIYAYGGAALLFFGTLALVWVTRKPNAYK